jgi:hypothetical protein
VRERIHSAEYELLETWLARLLDVETWDELLGA